MAHHLRQAPLSWLSTPTEAKQGPHTAGQGSRGRRGGDTKDEARSQSRTISGPRTEGRQRAVTDGRRPRQAHGLRHMRQAHGPTGLAERLDLGLELATTNLVKVVGGPPRRDQDQPCDQVEPDQQSDHDREGGEQRVGGQLRQQGAPRRSSAG